MWCLGGRAVLFAVLLVLAAASFKERLPFYHSTDELHSAFEELTRSCRTGNATLTQSGPAGLDVFTVKSAASYEGAAPAKAPALFVFGEHARELFSPESGLHFARSLCGFGKEAVSEDRARAALAASDFVIVTNANPQGRRMVEAGHYCKRTNENGVDLNRNYGSNWEAEQSKEAQSAREHDDDYDKTFETNPGPKAFSEPESQTIRDLASSRPPLLYLSVHTGAYLLGMPFGYSDQVKPDRSDSMMQMLQSISGKHCGGRCPFGGLDHVINYESKGCSLDWVAENLHTPYAFTWEVYTDDSTADQYVQQAQVSDEDRRDPKGGWGRFFSRIKSISAKQQEEKLETAEAEASGADAVSTNSDSSSATALVAAADTQTSQTSQTSQKAAADAEAAKRAEKDAKCLKQFNPLDEPSFQASLENWSDAYFDLAEAVFADAESVSSSGGGSASSPAASDGAVSFLSKSPL